MRQIWPRNGHARVLLIDIIRRRVVVSVCFHQSQAKIIFLYIFYKKSFENKLRSSNSMQHDRFWLSKWHVLRLCWPYMLVKWYMLVSINFD
jgi:hypothetical protein